MRVILPVLIFAKKNLTALRGPAFSRDSRFFSALMLPVEDGTISENRMQQLNKANGSKMGDWIEKQSGCVNLSSNKKVSSFLGPVQIFPTNCQVFSNARRLLFISLTRYI